MHRGSRAARWFSRDGACPSTYPRASQTQQRLRRRASLSDLCLGPVRPFGLNLSDPLCLQGDGEGWGGYQAFCRLYYPKDSNKCSMTVSRNQVLPRCQHWNLHYKNNQVGAVSEVVLYSMIVLYKSLVIQISNLSLICYISDGHSDISVDTGSLCLWKLAK